MILTSVKTAALTVYTFLVGGLLVASQSPGAMVLGVGLCCVVALVLIRGLGTTATN
ncbi:hypothetical protein [Salinirubrum litoreum]|uniref:Uncharacterized protein n=1 Tax=Salinirubrum litoreum TaxID=1126234 RepID=A0ABD5R675_9EURY|nr:hypothetical protein [Salinirubrum litoreum]